jgi:streptomycin 6-kinase
MLIDTSQCERKIMDVHGQAGVAWLAGLPALLAQCAARWSLNIQPPFPISSYNYVAPAVGPEGEPLVLKAGVPHGELWSEIDALLLFDGRGIARLLDFDRELGALLLERVLPGQSLWSVAGEAEQIDALAGVLRRLWRPLPAEHPFRTIADLARGFERLRAEFDGGYGPFPPARVERAAALFRELTGGGNVLMLIHGDANPGNILRSERDGWLAIDPKGYAGHPLWDVATYLNDPPVSLCRDDLISLQGRRVAALAEGLGAPRQAVLAWAEAHAVLSGWWSYEDHGTDWEMGMMLAEIYEEMQGGL